MSSIDIKLVGDGTARGTNLIDCATGKPLDRVSKLEMTLEAGSETVAAITVYDIDSANGIDEEIPWLKHSVAIRGIDYGPVRIRDPYQRDRRIGIWRAASNFAYGAIDMIAAIQHSVVIVDMRYNAIRDAREWVVMSPDFDIVEFGSVIPVYLPILDKSVVPWRVTWRKEANDGR